jgi:hypothetical protein
MTTPTHAEIERAARYIRATAEDERVIPILGRMIDAAQIVADASTRARDLATNFASAPDNLAHAIRLHRTADPDTRRTVLFRYHQLLANLISPPMGGPPLKLDFHALSPAARPHLLCPFLKLSVNGVFPHLDLERSTPPQQLTYVVTSGAVDVRNWMANLSAISAWLGGNYQLTDHTSTTITLALKPTLPALIPMTASFLKQGALFIGIDTTTQRPAYIPFSAMTSGTYIAGVAGAGKSNALHILLQSLFANLDLFTHVYLVDGKDGLAFNLYKDKHPKVTVLWEEQDFWGLTPHLVADMHARNTAQRQAGTDKATKDFVALIVDEMSTYALEPSATDKALNKRHATFLDELTTLARRGRSAGFRALYTSQEPTKESIPVSVRGNCQTTIGFRLPIDAHATMVWGKHDEGTLPADPRYLPTGRALVKQGDTGSLALVQFPLIKGGAP